MTVLFFRYMYCKLFMPDYYKRYIKMDSSQINKIREQLKSSGESYYLDTKASESAHSLTSQLQHSSLNNNTFGHRIRNFFFNWRHKKQKQDVIEVFDVIVHSKMRLNILNDQGESYLLKVCSLFLNFRIETMIKRQKYGYQRTMLDPKVHQKKTMKFHIKS